MKKAILIILISGTIVSTTTFLIINYFPFYIDQVENAAKNGNIDNLRKIIKDNNKKIAEESGRKALLWASLQDNYEMAELLIDSGVSVNSSVGIEVTETFYYRGHPINIAKSTKMIKLLIDRGADINAKGTDGNTTLNSYSQGCNLEIFKFLLDNGADPTIKDDNGRTPYLHLKEQKKELEKYMKIKTLLEKYN